MPAAQFTSLTANLSLDPARLTAFCDRWRILELDLFGSALRETLQPESDIDFLVTFRSDGEWSLVDHIRMEEELSELVQRKVDLVSRRGIERSANWIRRKAILAEARPVYSAGRNHAPRHSQGSSPTWELPEEADGRAE